MAGTLRVAVVGTQASTSPSDVTGTAVPILTVRFRVLSAAADDHTHSGVLQLTALELLNQGSYRFVENSAAQIDDARGGSQAADPNPNPHLTPTLILIPTLTLTR